MEQLIEAYKSKKLVLFVGAGLSMGLGLPSWNQLITRIAKELNYDPDIYQTLGDNLTLAEYYKITKGQIGPLRSWMDREWHSKGVDISKSKVHELIANADLDLIYTTNYDRWIELAFDHYKRPYSKIISVGDLATKNLNLPQIVKFHGDFDDDTTIVLDETSYFERLGFESPIDIKFRSDVLGKTVLFIGYSLTDLNVRYLFYRLSNIWKGSSRGVPQPPSFVFSSKPNPVQEAVLKQRNISMITSSDDDPNTGLAKFLEQIFRS